MKKFVTILTIISFLVCLSSLTSYATANVIVFGDSLSDIGNNSWVKTNGTVGAPITNLDKNNKQPIWINDFIMLQLHTNDVFPSKLRKHYSPYTANISYAWASAETGNNYLNDANDQAAYHHYNPQCKQPGLISKNNACVPGVLLQIKAYLKAVNNRPNSNTVFILMAGGNDIFDSIQKILYLLKHMENVPKAYDPFAILKDTVDMSEKPITLTFNNETIMFSKPVVNLVTAIRLLESHHIDKNNIYVINLPDLAKIPAFKYDSQQYPFLPYVLKSISLLFNINLQWSLYLTGTLAKDHIIPFYTLMDEIINDGQQYGFINVTDSCFANHATPYCHGYVFFNSKHPTTQAYKLFAKLLSKLIKLQ